MTDDVPDDSWMPDPDAFPTPPGKRKPRMRETPADEAVKARALGSTGQRLVEFIARYEIEDKDRGEAAERMKAVMAEAKGDGFNTKVLKKIIADRRRNAEEVADEEDTLRLYRNAIGV